MDSRLWVESGEWIEVKSSNVKAISYVSETKELFVQFHSTAKGIRQPVYVYEGVSPFIAETFFNAESYGKFVHQYLIGVHRVDGPYNRLDRSRR